MDIDKIKQKRAQEATDFKELSQNARVITAIKQSSEEIAKTVKGTALGGATLQAAVKEVTTKISELVQELEKQKPEDNSDIVEAIKQLTEITANISKEIVIPESEKIESVEVSNQIDYSEKFSEIAQALQKIDVKPAVKVQAPKIDLSGITSAITDLKDALKVDVEAPQVNVDMDAVSEGLDAVVQTIRKLKFPVPNYVLPFADSAGKAKQANVDSLGNLTSNSAPLTVRMDEGTANILYVGKAPAGTSETATSWQITKLDTSSTSNEALKFADGDSNFDNKWSDRATLTYA